MSSRWSVLSKRARSRAPLGDRARLQRLATGVGLAAAALLGEASLDGVSFGGVSFGGATFGAARFGAGEALAQSGGSAIKFDLIARPPVVDGLPGEWPRPLAGLGVVRGGGGSDLSAKGGLAYDDKQVYVAVDVTDEKLVADGDRIDLIVGFSGGASTTVSIHPGAPGKPARATAGGRPIAGAKVVEAPRKGGWTLEAQFPWSVFDAAKTIRVGLRGSLTVHDADKGTAVEGSASNAAGTTWAQLPSLPTTPEQDLADALVTPKRLGAPTVNLLANVTGDAFKERILVYGSYLVVLGPTFRGGREFYWNDMAMTGKTLQVASCETKDADGDGREDLVVRKRFTEGKVTREVLQVLSFAKGEVPNVVFSHEVGVTTAAGAISNDVSFETDKGKLAIRFKPGTAKGLDESSYKEPVATSWDPVLLPWGPIESQTYTFRATGFEKTAEQRRPGAPPPRSAGTPAAAKPAPVPPPPPPGADLPKVHELFRKERGATGAPRFDLVADLVGDGRSERALLHDKDLVVFGAGYKSGKGYAYTTLPFASGDDVKSVLSRDATGDGKFELVVRGLLKARASSDAGGGEVERTIELVYQVQPDVIRRVFGVEVGRAMGGKSIVSTLGYKAERGKGSIVVGVGKATGWTQATYPFTSEAGSGSGLEPLILPWSGSKSVTYTWSGSAFAR